MAKKEVDKPFLGITIALVILGFFIFSSASLGLVVRDGAPFGAVFMRQLIFGIVLGGLLSFIASRIDYLNWRKYAFFIFLGSLLLSLAVLIPGVGFEHGGARRWISLGFASFQPAEILKFGFVVYFAAWLASVKDKVKTFKFGVIPIMILLVLVGTVLLIQRDTGTLFVIVAAGMGMYLVAGARWRDIALIILVGMVMFGGLLMSRDYLLNRMTTFLNPDTDPQGLGYQIQQSLIAVGSGEWFGRGFGQSIQKFGYLPEPVGDSVFSVFAEEWGFVGSMILIILFTAFAVRGLWIASRAPTIYGTFLVVGIILLIVVQSLANIASMIGVFPLSGMPLLFVSQGGTALAFALLGVGTVLNVSRQIK